MNRMSLPRISPATAVRVRARAATPIATPAGSRVSIVSMRFRRFATEPTPPPASPPLARPSQSSIELALNIPPAPPFIDALHASVRSASSPAPQPPANHPTPDPDPWDATRTTLQAFWSRYGNYVYAYLVWSVVGSLALNVLWTRQEREELEDTAMVKIRKLERQLKAVEDQLAVKLGAVEVDGHGKGMQTPTVGTAQVAATAAWYLPWTWFSSSAPMSPPTDSLTVAGRVVGQVQDDQGRQLVPSTDREVAIPGTKAKENAETEQPESIVATFSANPSSTHPATPRRHRSSVTLY